MNAIQLAKELEVVSWKDAQTEAADMLRRQHEAIRVLRESLILTKRQMYRLLDSINRDEMLYDGDSFHEALESCKQALKDTEEMK